MNAIDSDCEALDSASKRLDEINAGDAYAAAELAYLDAMDKALITVEEEYRARGERLPSERQREAHAHRKIELSVRETFVKLKREKELIETWGRMREKALSGRQSQLSFLKAEGSAPAPQSSWMPRRAA